MADTIPDIETRTDEIAAGPAEASGDQGGMKQQSIPDMLALEKHRRRAAAAASTSLPVRFGKLRPPGAV